MKLTVFFGLLLAIAYAHAEENVQIEEEEDVLVLTDDNFEAAIQQHNPLLVEFYAPWCGHCKSLAPEYAQAAKTLKERAEPIRIAKLDATAATKTSEKYDIQGFPTLKLFKGSVEKEDVKDYDGGRTNDEIVRWMVKQTEPPVKIIEEAEDLENAKEENEVVVVALLDDLEGEEFKTLEKVANTFDKVSFLATKNQKLVSGDLKKAPGVVLYKKFDEGKNILTKKFAKDAIKEFVSANSRELVMTFTQEKASQIFGGDLKVHMLVFADEQKDYFKNLNEQLKEAAKSHRSKIMHIIIPPSEDRITEFFQLKEHDFPTLILVDMESGLKKYPMEKKGEELVEALSGEEKYSKEIVEFETLYLEGMLKPTLKSAEPVDDKDEAVKVIVGKEFASRVVESDKDVLVKFYAPWCGHCKSLAPKYQELAEAFANVPSIMIAKMDSTENEIDYPGVNVEGFPTLYFFPKDSSKLPVLFDGSRDVKGMTEFLKKHAEKFELNGETFGKEHDEL